MSHDASMDSSHRSAAQSATGNKTLPQESLSDQSCSSVHNTLLSNNESDTPQVHPKSNPVHPMARYDPYIRADISSRVFMPADDFFTQILHLPHDWHTNNEIQSLIATIKNDATFRTHVKTYVEQCNPKSGDKTSHPDGLMFDCAFDVLGVTEKDCGLGLDAKPVDSGSQDIPDSWSVLRSMLSSGNLFDAIQDNGPGNKVSWVQSMRCQEFKPDECYLDERI
ncbi:uncharacterized protein EV420DRAFT_1692079 [Desarmillaria tabescens]|uniref:Uncharacterized protein n=1 Tax=Armillaria tabescens TaxID=1929756 RepID=A0AA39K9A2_ARMTA|nr:uncharacterized protein EV420DRAFT_1692079 [Desarmillaria tabescens]KAK0455604.1 hypothetical protein EV420DRAFT_1692079 [Desarmillaria tabescens]